MKLIFERKSHPVFLPREVAKVKLILWKFLLHLQNNYGTIRGVWRLSKLRSWLIKEYEYLPIKYGNLILWISPGNIMDRNLLHHVPYEPEVVGIISKYVRAGFSYLDIGAYTGLHLVMAASNRVKDNQLFIGVEPAPHSYQVLKKNIKSNNFSFVKTINCGLGDIKKRTNLYLSSTNNKGMHSLFPLDTMKGHVEIEIMLLDEILDGYGVDSWIIKIDTEGSEISVLDGGANLLSTIDNLVIIVEIHPENLHRAGNSVKMLFDRLKKMDCKLFILEDMYPINGEDDYFFWLDNTNKEFTNILCIKGENTIFTLTH